MLGHGESTHGAPASRTPVGGPPRESDDGRSGPTRSRSDDLASLEALIEPLTEAVLVTDSSGAVRLTNVAADRLFAGDPVRSDTDLLSRFEPAVTDAPRAPDGTSPRQVVRARHQPNTWLSLDRIPFERTTGFEAAFVLRDVSNSRDLRAEREAFLSVLSHELRTPLTTIYAGSSVLARRPRLSPPATRTLAVDISLEAARLYDLVENLLVIARLERRILDPIDEPVDVARALEAAVRLVGERFPDSRIRRRGARHAPRVHGDATYVDQACRNVLVSLVRAAARPGAGLAVRLDVDRAAGEVAVRVRDEGPLLPAEQVARAFDLPTETSEGRLAGIGLGLFVVRHAVEAMGGRSWARTVDDGLEVGFALRMEDRTDEDGI